MGLRRRGGWNNGETLRRFRPGCSVFNGRVFAALRGRARELAGSISENRSPSRHGERGRSGDGRIVGRSVGG